MPWKYTDDTKTVVIRSLANGGLESKSVNDSEVQAWIAEGNTPLPAADPIPLTKSQKLTAFNAEYNPQILSLNTQIAIAVSATKNVTSETSLRASMAALQTEYNNKKVAIMNG